MMKRITTIIRSSLILALLASLSIPMASAGAVPTETDSLFVTWQDPGQSDSVRVDAFESYIRKRYLFSQPDSVILLTNALKEFSMERNYPRAYALADYLHATAVYLQGNYTDAIHYNQLSFNKAESIPDKNMMATNLNLFGLIYEKQGSYSRALDYHQRSLKLAEELEDQRGVAFSLNNIGEILNSQGKSLEALDYFQRSLTLLEGLGENQWIANALMNIGMCYASQGNHARVFDYYLPSLKIYEEIDDKRGIIQCLHVIGESHYAMGDIPEALDYFGQSLDISEAIDYKRGAALSLTDIGNIYYDEKEYRRSLAYCQRSLGVAEAMGALELQRDACNCIYQNHREMGDTRLALSSLQKLNALDDSLKRQETAKSLQQMEMNFQALQDSLARAEEQRRVKEAYEEEARQDKMARNISVGIGLFALLLAGGYYSRWRYVRRSKTIIEKEKDRADRLLLNILPEEIAEELKENGKAAAREFENVSVLFTDFVDFTAISSKLSAVELVKEINACFEAFDGIIEKFKVEKIKTIGDAYMAAGGLPVQSAEAARNTVLAALEMQQFITARKAEKARQGETAFAMRAGIHSGHVVAGIVGVKKFQYDIWGDTVNTASRIESKSEAGQVNISRSTWEQIKDDPQFTCTPRGRIAIKGKGAAEMYFVEQRSKPYEG